ARARMDHAYGGHGNQVIWYGLGTDEPDPFLSMDRWLAAVEADHSGQSLTQKIVADRPADITDRCEVGSQGFPTDSACQQPVRRHPAAGPLLCPVLWVASWAPATGAPDMSASMVVKRLSNRAGLIAGGDGLAEIVLPAGVSPTGLAVSLYGCDVSSAFGPRPA